MIIPDNFLDKYILIGKNLDNNGKVILRHENLVLKYENKKLNSFDSEPAFIYKKGIFKVEIYILNNKISSLNNVLPSVRVIYGDTIISYFYRGKRLCYGQLPGIVIEKNDSVEFFLFNRKGDLTLQKNVKDNISIHYKNEKIDMKKSNKFNGFFFTNIDKLTDDIEEVFMKVQYQNIDDLFLSEEEIKDRDDNYIEHTLSFLYDDNEKSKFLLNPMDKIIEEYKESEELYELNESILRTIRKKEEKKQIEERRIRSEIIKKLTSPAKILTRNRKAPNILAKECENNEVRVGLDGGRWIVLSDVKGKKRWQKCNSIINSLKKT